MAHQQLATVLERTSSHEAGSAYTGRITVVIPTFREAENLKVLVPRIFECFADCESDVDVIVVDDNSSDGTDSVCAELAESYPIELVVRRSERGLSSAVIHGMNKATGEVIVVMDADCSHPPERIPALAEAISNGADFAIGSRYVAGGQVEEGWGLFRWLNSRVATALAWPLCSVTDPMAGFFAIRRESFVAHVNELNPVGYKIGLELIVKCGCSKIQEIPISFRNRLHGESKLSVSEQLKYLLHLTRLYRHCYYTPVTVLQFGLVGLLGMATDLLVVGLLLSMLPFPMARLVGILAGMLQNFALNRAWTFAEAQAESVYSQLAKFTAACAGGAAINWLISTALHSSNPVFADRPLLAALCGVLAGFAANYFCARLLVFRARPAPSA